MTGAVDVPATTDLVAPEDRLGTLFDVHHARLYRLARRLTVTDDDARDLVQDTFVRAARSLAAVPTGQIAEEAWLVRTLVNLCRDNWRRRETRVRAHQHGFTAGATTTRATQEASLLAHDLVWKALRRLPPRQRAVLVLHELEDVGVGDIARMLGVTRVTVRWHLSTGRRGLARAIKENGHG